MIEVFIEYWSKGGEAEYPWSVWADGKQAMASHGRRTYDDPRRSEADAMKFCRDVLDTEPDCVTRL